MWPALERQLAKVAKPARYIGLEDGAPASPRAPGKVGWLLCYPDTYEIGLPNQGLQILREILNERDDAFAERGYAVWTDLEAVMRRERIPFFSIETHAPAAGFDVIAFNLSAELVYTNVLNCVDLAGVPVRASDRTDSDPLVMVGGHCTYNPEPLADFVDVVVLGDGEEVVSEITEVLAAWKAEGKTPGSRANVLRALARVEGVYVPSLYDVDYDGEFLAAVTPRYPDVPERVEKRTIADLAEWPYPKQQLVPLTEVVHDRLNVEVFRGCTRGCRFCQAGMITRPVRERPADQVRTMIDEGLRRTGYDEVTLTSLSTADFSGIEQTVSDVMNLDTGSNQPVTLGLPSLRVDAFTVGLANQIQNARRTGLTFAPEAGTWRMRQVINKLISEEDLYGAVHSAYSEGWRRMKLYFLTGLPTETDEDTLGIAELARNSVELGREFHKNPSVTVSVGGFVPKPFTPFQWFGQNTEVELRRKINLLRDAIRKMPRVTRRQPQVARPPGHGDRGAAVPRRPPSRPRGRAGVAAGRHLPGVVRALRHRPLAWCHGRVRSRPRLVHPPAPHRGRGPAVGPPLGRAAQGLPLDGLAGRPRRAGLARLPLDTLLRLRGLHRLLHRAHRRLGHAPRGRESRHGPTLGPWGTAGLVDEFGCASLIGS